MFARHEDLGKPVSGRTDYKRGATLLLVQDLLVVYDCFCSSCWNFELVVWRLLCIPVLELRTEYASLCVPR